MLDRTQPNTQTRRSPDWYKTATRWTQLTLAEDDPAWKDAKWQPCEIALPPKEWGGSLPRGVMPKDVWGFDAEKGQPKEWPMRFSLALWSVTLKELEPGAYEFRVRAVDLNGYAQPEPRPYQKSGMNAIPYRPIVVMS